MAAGVLFGREWPSIIAARERYARFRASAIDARSGETEGLDPKGESAAAESRDAQNPRISAP